MNTDMSKIKEEEYIDKCKHCGVRVDWPIPDHKRAKSKWLMPIAMLLSFLVMIFTTSLSFYFLLFGIVAFASYLVINPPVLYEEDARNNHGSGAKPNK